MKIKKVFMVIVLILFIVGICALVVIVNRQSSKKSRELTNEISNSANLPDNQANGNVRKSNEKANVDFNNVVEITDNYFIEQTNDIYLNLNQYKGKTVKIEGLIYSYADSNGDVCYAVIRNTPGCCGSDGLAGLDIRYDEEYPELDTWVEVVGVIGTDTVYGNEIPAIQVYSITEKETGTTFVTN